MKSAKAPNERFLAAVVRDARHQMDALAGQLRAAMQLAGDVTPAGLEATERREKTSAVAHALHQQSPAPGCEFELAVGGMSPRDSHGCRGGRRGDSVAEPGNAARVLAADDHRPGAEAGVHGDLHAGIAAHRGHDCGIVAGNGDVPFSSAGNRAGSGVDRRVRIFVALGGSGELRNFWRGGERTGRADDRDHGSVAKNGDPGRAA